MCIYKPTILTKILDIIEVYAILNTLLMTQMDVYWVMNYLPLDITPYAPIHLEKTPDNSLIDRYITGRGPDKYVPFYLILWYASKNIYLS